MSHGLVHSGSCSRGAWSGRALDLSPYPHPHPIGLTQLCSRTEQVASTVLEIQAHLRLRGFCFFSPCILVPNPPFTSWSPLASQLVKRVINIWAPIVSQRERAMAPHPSTLAWKIQWMEPGRLQSMGSLRVGHNWVTSLSLFTFMHWRRKWQLTPVFLPGESQGREPGGLTSMGSQSRTRLKQLSSSSSQPKASQVTLVVKNPPANAGDIWDMGSIPGSGIFSGEGHGNPLQYSCLENPMDRGAWWPTVHRVVKSWTWLKWLSTEPSTVAGVSHDTSQNPGR